MIDFQAMRERLPNCYVAESRTTMLRLRSSTQALTVVRLNPEGSPVCKISRDVVSFRWQYVTRLTKFNGDESWNVQISPNVSKLPIYLGTLHRLNELTPLKLRNDELNFLLEHTGDYFIVCSSGFVMPYDEGDQVISPEEFGLRPALPSAAA
jgi:hypothetical protein